jgi:hypothetical protein
MHKLLYDFASERGLIIETPTGDASELTSDITRDITTEPTHG